MMMSMPMTGFRGPYRLTPELVNERVLHNCTGAYALGTDSGFNFKVHYVARTGDIAGALRKHASDRKNRHFEFHYLPSAQAAFEQECLLYHAFMPPDNEGHPQRPDDADWKCPHCG